MILDLGIPQDNVIFEYCESIIPPLNVSGLVAVSGLFFWRYRKSDCACVMPVVDDDAKNDLLYGIPL